MPLRPPRASEETDMRLVTFEVESTLGRHRRTGALSGDRVIDLSAARADQLRRNGRATGRRVAEEQLPTDMLALLELGEPALEAAREAIAHAEGHGDDEAIPRISYGRDEVWLLAPIPRPPSLRDFMVAEEHVRRSFKGDPPAEWWNIPVYYKGNCEEIYGPEDTIPWPAYTEKLDYELEMCAVIGASGRDVSAQRADELIVGYTIYNDWSARDIQMREMSVGIGPGYGKDFASSIGPAIVTKDEFDRDGAKLTARIDGEVWSEGVLGAMHFSFQEIIAWVSQDQTLRPGDLLGSGTVGGGCGLELDRWIAEGAVVELEAEGIGVLRNDVSARGAGPVRATTRRPGERSAPSAPGDEHPDEPAANHASPIGYCRGAAADRGQWSDPARRPDGRRPSDAGPSPACLRAGGRTDPHLDVGAARHPGPPARRTVAPARHHARRPVAPAPAEPPGIPAGLVRCGLPQSVDRAHQRGRQPA